MAAITYDQIRACYDAARKPNEESRNARAKMVSSEVGMGHSSATHYIKAVEEMRKGGHYNMTVQLKATALYLDWIGRDDGLDAKVIAAETVLRHVNYYAQLEKGSEQPAIRAIAEAILAHVTPKSIRVFRKLEKEKRAAAEGLPDAELERLALTAEPGPRTTMHVVTTVRRRDPNVCEYVLRQAAGVCQACQKPAPFLSRHTRKPFLEVHHRIPLAEGGDDTIGNAVALCPNCHREAHFGENWEDYRL